MTLIIDPTTEEGKNLVEGISWAQAQLNTVLEKYFANGYKLMKGLRIEFILPVNKLTQDEAKVGISALQPTDLNNFELAVAQAANDLGFEKKEQATAVIVDPHTGGNLIKK